MLSKRVAAVVVLVVSGTAWGAATGRLQSALPQQTTPPAQAAMPVPGAAPAVDFETSVSEVTRAVETLRGWKFRSPVPVVTLTVEAARRDLEQEVNAASTQEATALRIAAMRVAGLIARDADALQDEMELFETGVEGYYSFRTKTLSIIARPGAHSAGGRQIVLAHELTHALDDQRFNLGALMVRRHQTMDSLFVARALVEGSAHALEGHYRDMLLASGRVNRPELMMEAFQSLKKFPRGLNVMLASYICGSAFLTRHDYASLKAMPDDREIGANLEAAIKALPRSSEQIIHPEKYWDRAQRDEPVIVDDASVERWLAESGWTTRYRDTLGEIYTAALTQPPSGPKDLGKFMSAKAWTNTGSIGWGGDRIYLVSGTSSDNAPPTKAVWVTAWDGMLEGASFINALAKGPLPDGYLAVGVADRVVVTFLGFTPSEQTRLAAALEHARFRYQRDGKPWIAESTPPARER